jgi:hypothetical protein
VGLRLEGGAILYDLASTMTTGIAKSIQLEGSAGLAEYPTTIVIGHARALPASA